MLRVVPVCWRQWHAVAKNATCGGIADVREEGRDVSSTGTVTLVFTDLVGSTAIGTSLHPDDTERLRQTHFAILRDAVVATGGNEVKNLGDGLMVAFSSPSRALACAVAMQQGIQRHNRRAELPLAVRIGIAGGEVTENEGDYFGDPVVEAARLCATADGGQILATDTVRAMVGRHATVELAPFGELELKGLPHRVSTVEVQWTEASGDDDGVPLPSRLAQAATTVLPFAGRAAELALLDDVRTQADSGRLQVALLGGEPGVGKTSLAAQWARTAHRKGAAVAFGSCLDGLNVPYLPWITALGHLVAHAPETALASLRPVQLGALRGLLPRESERLAAGEAVEAGAETERYLLFEAVSGLLSSMSSESPIVIVLDDLHWADAASLDLLRHLVVTAAGLRVAVVATHRDVDVSRGHPLTALLAELRREPAVTRIGLAGLADGEVMELIEVAAGFELPPEGIALAHTLCRETDGNPFFTVELLRRLSDTGVLQLEADGRYALVGDVEELSLPTSVREVIADRAARLGEEPLRVLSTAAVIGPEFDLDVLAAATEIDEDRLIEILEGAATVALVTESSESPGRYRFVHALIAHTLAHDLGPTRRQRMHLRIARALEALGAERAGRFAELAHYWAAAGGADSGRTRYFARRAGEAALDALAPVDAIGWFSRALELLDPHADDVERGWLLAGLAQAQLDAGQPEYRVTRREAGRVALRTADRELLVAIALCTGIFESVEPSDADLIAVVEAALSAVGTADSFPRARLLTAFAEALDQRDWQRREDLASEAAAMAGRLDDQPGFYELAPRIFWNLMSPARLAERRELAERAAAITSPATSPVAELDVLHVLHYGRVEGADRPGADAAFARLEELADRLGTPFSRWNVLQGRSWRFLCDGDIAAAEQTAQQGLEIATEMGVAAAMPAFGAQLLSIRVQQGRVDEIAAFVAEGVDDFSTLSDSWKSAVALVNCMCGRLDDVQITLEQEFADRFDHLPEDQAWLFAMCAWAECAVALGRRDVAAFLAERLRPYGSHMIYASSFMAGVVARTVGCLDAMLGDHASAEANLRHALDLHERFGAVYWTARTQLDLAEVVDEPELVEAARLAIDRYGLEGLRPRLN
jgi:class 3 adenylate cyclase